MTFTHAFAAIQHRPGIPLGPRLFSREGPKLFEALDIMPPPHGILFVVRTRFDLSCLQIARLSTKGCTAFLCFQDLDDPLANLQLVVPAEYM